MLSVFEEKEMVRDCALFIKNSKFWDRSCIHGVISQNAQHCFFFFINSIYQKSLNQNKVNFASKD